MITISGANVVVTVYSDTACTTAIANPKTYPTACTTASSISTNYITGTSVPPSSYGAGVVENYYDTYANCQNNAGSIYAWQFFSSGCLGGALGISLGVACTGSNVIYSTYAGNTCQGGSTASATYAANQYCTNVQVSNTPFADEAEYGYYFTCVNQPPPAAAASSSSCFAGSESVQLESGATVPIADVRVGDKVLAYSSAGQTTVFSDVVAVPHAPNNVQADFQHIVLASGADIKMTADHLLPSGSCSLASLPLARAADVQVGNCVQTTEGQSTVVSNSVVTGNGVYTIVTEKADYVVVNGVVASPFAVNHAVANFVYGFHRMVYGIAPKMVAPISGVLSNLAAYFTK